MDAERMDAEQLRAFSDTARRFAEQEVGPMLDTESRDGDLRLLNGILGKAEHVGLLASADPESPGHEFGVWGKACLSEGPAFSLAILKAVARKCAGVAGCLHFGGLGALEMMEAAVRLRRAAVAFFEDTWHLTWDAINHPPENAAHMKMNGGLSVICGDKSFVWSPAGCEGFVVYVKGASGWERSIIPRDTPGLFVTDMGHRTGLAALRIFHLSFDRAPVDSNHMLTPGQPLSLLHRSLLGLCAMAVGNAEGALETASQYARDRYQGGGQIETHPAVLILLGDSVSRIAACNAHLSSLSSGVTDARHALRHVLAAKLRISGECAQAVTDCLQVLGGYGYMEDFRLEKRLRDGMTLKGMAIRPDDLRMLCAEGELGGSGYEG
jgi:alkylation response protein AidB-like acyl-CoA dehydrogenase